MVLLQAIFRTHKKAVVRCSHLSVMESKNTEDELVDGMALCAQLSFS